VQNATPIDVVLMHFPRSVAAAIGNAYTQSMEQCFGASHRSIWPYCAVAADTIAATRVQVAGIMSTVSFSELLPRALSYDKTGRATYYGVMSGMAFMAASLVLLSLWD
jgi:zinc transporter ZupT